MKTNFITKLIVALIIFILIAVIIYFTFNSANSGVPAPLSIPPISTPMTTPPSSTNMPLGTSTPPPPAASTTSPANLKVITQADSNTTVDLSKNEPFIIQLGDTMKWNVSFDPAIVTLIPNSTMNGSQGLYEANSSGTTTLRATGAPICNPGEACPQFLVSVMISLVIR